MFERRRGARDLVLWALAFGALGLAACRVQAPATTAEPAGSDKQPDSPGVIPARAPEIGLELSLADPLKQRALLNANLGFDPEVLALSDAPTSDFKQPPTRISKGDRLALDLNIGFADLELVDGVTQEKHKVRLRTYGDEVNGAGIPGPTLIIDPRQLSKTQKHVTLAVHLCNKLGATSCKDPAEEGDHSSHGGDPNNPAHYQSNDTNLHTHGLHVSPSGKSDNVFILVKPGQFFDYEIQVPKDHPPGTHWYHAHNHGSTATQLSNGMAGALIVAGGLDDAPGIKGRKDRLFVFQQVQWDRCQPKDPSKPRYEMKDKVWTCNGTLAAFGAVDWLQASGLPFSRPTLVNGQIKPVFSMNSGEVERWRLIHGGVRQNLNMVLCPEGDKECREGEGPRRIPLNRIAVDGIATGKIQALSELLMGPGYRSDVLVQAPVCAKDPTNPDKKCVYHLIDSVTTPDAGSLQGITEQGQILAVVEVMTTTARGAQKLPTDKDLGRYAPYRNVDPNLVTDTQKMTYAPTIADLTTMCAAKDEAACLTLKASNDCKANQADADACRRSSFNVDARPFAASHVRRLPLGATSKWALRSGAWGPHPFHIHVNPFQLASVSCDAVKPGDKPIDPLVNLDIEKNIWRDTLLVQKGCTYEVFTRYENFAGKFVQHCHILTHEDQGMMEVIEIFDPPK
ncbi:multicopper oxidase domain-containing protein [Nannocystis sp.]|uniref:multicopper oxidase family protein n=1 Tax=Nannocystis sp. TaxID=1962667 RepID=UPI0025E0E9E4|nr:multicopper oxidase domain-containing protein [Nannocystis sp.]MBK7828223.1 multicopper oxidase domain-containing protein [Nannocystis sp.]